MQRQSLFTSVPIYTIAFLFNLVFSLTAIIIPLYGVSVGYSATQIGILLSIPGLFQVTLRMFTGFLSDRFGEKKMLVFTHFMVVSSCIVFAFDLKFLMLVIFQIIMGISRAIYWPTSQSYTSRISKTESSTIIGRCHSFSQAGRILGIMFAGWAILNIGYLYAFRLIAAIAFAGLLTNLVLKSIPLSTGERKKIENVGMSFKNLIKIPPLQLAIVNAFFAGLMSALSQSFLPVWLKGLGNSEGLISIIITAYMVGSLLTGRVFATILAKLKFPALLQLSLVGIGLGYLLVSVVSGFPLALALTLMLGFSTGFVHIAYQVMVVDHSEESNRGAIYSFVGLGWGLAFLVGPTMFGLLVDSLTITSAFACLGILILICAVFLKSVYNHFVESYQREQKASSC